ncbi:hypothetical protein ACIA8G_09990 [Lentzea sp. NPDC051213]|uniref:hypothetical protein n=1 Tax=Lentzea sp. NPDC051213 TaxID=3364126 RepID=UPI00379051E7
MKTLVVIGVFILVSAGTAFVVVQQGGGWNTLVGKAWAITYEVTAQAGTQQQTQVQYAENPDRYKKRTPESISLSTPLPFKTEVVINAGEKAQVLATPSGGETLSCRILLDGEKVLASATAAPGQEVRCEAVTNM